ncbi:NAD-dependent epimerase/dehydratase family protein [Mesobaculum littorinae]|uniref:NAD-dependent epimerase/dehydratase family protein n=1 Tax=Mesobaculum littorinae TaxID=2486419 RepID=A0A438ADH1_9RHOB|nr:NAD-dependent epimerase/dehydratase family protein [Mesobaculum littorinae]RVV96743.1 NAD-dependent epimerase/dehydratase family protein [Mesobaculum littorinae]
MTTPVLLGATGTVARLVRHSWPAAAPAPVCLARRAAPGIDAIWDMEGAPPPRMADSPSAVIDLSGVVPGPGAQLERNADLALAALAAARSWGAGRLFWASSSSIYGATSGPVDEDTPPSPLVPYGAAKARAEAALIRAAAAPGAPRLTILRLGNVAFAGQPFYAARQGRVTLDRFADGSYPRRSYIGPRGLAAVLSGLLQLDQAGAALPGILNVAAARPTGMDAVLDALGADWGPRPAPADAVSELWLDTTRLESCLPGRAGSGDATDLVAEGDALPDAGRDA